MSGGGNTNTTISWPNRPDWHILWGNGPLDNFQMDIVGFLAVLGESSVTANAQVSALSRLFLLPRLLPAPQALLPPSRPTTLPSEKAWVTSVHTGNYKEHIHHVANILLGEELSTFTVRCVKVTKKYEPYKGGPTWTDIFFRGVQKEGPHPSRNATMKPELMTPGVKAKASGPLTWVTLIGFFLSLALFIISITLGDGFSLIATILLSGLSTLIGFANKWNLKLAKRGSTSRGPDPGDTVIRYPNGSFLVVKCDDDIARELYFAPEGIKYDIESVVVYRLISLLGTLLLMLGIIFLANAKLQLQFAWAGAYGIINAAHWAAAAVSPRHHWDLSCYELVEESVEGGPHNKTFTEALWKAILASHSTRWVHTGSAAPQTAVWDIWLEQAEQAASDMRREFTVGPAILPIPAWATLENEKGYKIWQQPKDWEPKRAYNEIDDAQKAEEIAMTYSRSSEAKKEVANQVVRLGAQTE